MDAFEEYIVKRGYIQPTVNMDKVILADNELLAAIAGVWRGSNHAIEAVLRKRVEKIQKEILQEATPFEVPILRQAMVEVAFIADDFEAYAAEYERRKKDDLTVNGEASPPPVVQRDNAEDNGGKESAM